jgi:hypothetical protein
MRRSFRTAFFVFCFSLILLSAIFPNITHGDTTEAKKIYSTDFESVTKKNRNSLNMGIDNYFDFDGSNVTVFMDDGTLREDSPAPHSGHRDVCLDVDSGYRNEFNLINMENLVDSELFISVWLYLPKDFQMSLSQDNWLELIDPLFTASPAYAPYFAVMVTRSTSDSGYGLRLVQRDVNNVFSVLQTVPYIDLPVGQWFNIQYYVFRDATNGVIKVWLNDPARQNDPILDKSDLHMTNPNVNGWFTTIAKIYHDIQDKSTYRLWVDDLEVWNGLPPAPLNANVWSDKGDNSQLPNSQGCLGSYTIGSTVPLYCTVNKDANGKLDLIDPAGKVTTLVNEQLSVKTYSLAPQISGPAGYWRVDFKASTDGETSTDSFQLCVVENYVSFNGEILSATSSSTAGNLYQVKVDSVISDPTGKLQEGKTVMVSWNNSLADISSSLSQGAFVKIHGGYASSAVGFSGETVFLANANDYMEQVQMFTVTVDPNGGRIYVDDAASPITVVTSYQWALDSAHKLFAEPPSGTAGSQTVFSRWSDGNTDNPRNVAITGSTTYMATWSTVPTPPPLSVSVLSPKNQTYTTADVPLTIKVSGSPAYIGYSLDGQAEVAITQNVTLRGLSDGTHRVSVTVKDEAANTVHSETVYFTVETRPPVQTYSVTVDPNGGTLYVDNASEPITAKTTYNWTQDSVHTIYAESTVDASSGARLTFSTWADGDGSNPRTITVTGDAVYTALWTYVPAGTTLSVTLLTPENGTITPSDVPLTLNINGSASWIAYSLDGADNVTIAGNTTLHGLPDGPHDLTVYVGDFFTDKVSTVTVHFTVEAKKPAFDWTWVIVIAVIVTVVVAVAVVLWRYPKAMRRIKSFF